MLAQNLKTADALRISKAEFDAHVTVLRMLERGEFVHTPSVREPTKQYGFNMGHTGTRTSCGTVACIGGWVAFLLNRNPSVYVDSALGERMKLYFPNHFHDETGIGDGELCNITMEQAAIALRSYLTHGEPRWAEAIA